MLVLSRKLNEEILINGEIRVTVLQVNGKQIRLGIDAPRHIAIQRREVADATSPPNPAPAESVPR